MSHSAGERGGPQHIPRQVEWRSADAPPYQLAADLNLAQVSERLANYEPGELVRGPAVDRPAEPGRRSAVLIAIYEGDHGPTTILTRRPMHMRKHAGEIAFPGGSHDETDESLWHTALREAEEEVALDPALPRQVGMLDRFVTGASFSLVQPFVAALDEPPQLAPSPDEVDAILHVPLAELADSATYRREEWHWSNEWRAMHFYDLIGDTVWGATALMVHNLLEVVSVR